MQPDVVKLFSLDETHDAALQSWVESANDPQGDFPIQNLPFGRFRLADEPDWRIGVAIGSKVLDLRRTGLINFSDINRLMRLLPETRRELRALLSAGLSTGSQRCVAWARHLHAMDEVELGLPCVVGNYIDFPVGLRQAAVADGLMRPGDPPLPKDGSEWQLGIILGRPNALGHPIPIQEAENHVFGLTLLHDWSARGIQTWEQQSPRTFLPQSFATTVSPWIVTLDALAPFRVPHLHPRRDPAPPAYLDSELNRRRGAFNIDLQARIHTVAMKADGMAAQQISQSNFAAATYWTVAQLVALHTANGRSLRAGDLLGAGALSGPRPEQTEALQHGDTVTLSARCHTPGRRSIGFGRCSMTVMASIPDQQLNQEQEYADLQTRKRDPATGR